MTVNYRQWKKFFQLKKILIMIHFNQKSKTTSFKMLKIHQILKIRITLIKVCLVKILKIKMIYKQKRNMYYLKK